MVMNILKCFLCQLLLVHNIFTLPHIIDSSSAPLLIVTNLSTFPSTAIIVNNTYSSLNYTAVFKNATTKSWILSKHLAKSQKQQADPPVLRFGYDHAANLDPNEYCKDQPNGYDCDGSGILVPKFYWDVEKVKCSTHHFGNCKGNINMFDTLTDCYDTCREPGKSILFGNFTAKTYCKFQPSFGTCYRYYPKFYYDLSTRTCRGFSYSGCGGNLNRFDTHESCMSSCAEHSLQNMQKEN